ncbi:hypothetical protein NEUTE1DRAFT_140357 [Neurospora tetrasperma FGSC 2508]|uniref:Uncharacterized protein n=1 Tax=Neurospora tetrasperma (strain FGSC 2508 / ATCC MYA-4615 / P0657) TaxID=510951 RepID=F8MVW0_NEUT8|nr:uncharacterized protein NEUTE1DRAFT_140357 [Neurospora tetrasperma FGSC 2508]EGO54008.1 hypothetical protein NEUTE1DRAFT_140357 [Neurospora tetrasperma FGSC 2508]EGZ68571.1 hypothetical protein NEUTE2DRAFT_133217 [Neurospora tetrasperma FGSC 2509]
MSHVQNRDHSEQPTEQVAHSSSSNSAAGSEAVPARSAGDQMDRNFPEKVTLFTADKSLSEQVAPPTPEDAVQSRTNHPVQNSEIQNAVEVEEVVLPSIESPTENLPNDNDYATDPAGLSESELRRRAVAWMERTYHHLPNGSVVQPPSYFQRTRSSPAGRPAIWIKDFVWGHIRPRRLTNDRLADMPLERRESWARMQRREWEEIEEEKGETQEEGG